MADTFDNSHRRILSDISVAESATSDTTLASPTLSHLTSPGSPSAGPAVIPPAHPFRTLVLCFDGTGDQFDLDNSNIVELVSVLKKDDQAQQLVYYQPGIGTSAHPSIMTPMAGALSKAADEAIAWNLDAHVMAGYEFLMQNYTAKDRICLFGFSRGAYTARSLAGMIHKVGLLPACNYQQVPFAYKMYTRADELGWKQSNDFKKAFSIDVDIEFIGVWDTVSSVGLIPRRLPFTTSNTVVRTFRHAISLDEHRAKFQANLWNRPDEIEQVLSISDQQLKEGVKPKVHSKFSMRALEQRYGKDPTRPTDIDEVWFAGCHCDVGGGSVSNGTKHSLARISLRWMIRECFKTNTGILFQSEGIQRLGIQPSMLFPTVVSRPPPLPVGTAQISSIPRKDVEVVPSSIDDQETEEELDLKDALSPIYDQLILKWIWWILEFLPIKHRYQKPDNTWGDWIGWNLGRARSIPDQKSGVKVHRTVRTRMEAKTSRGRNYKPRATMDFEKVTWVE